ncbi:MAG TPA: hypothetical protein VKA88_03395 [Solirubrobacterales bacterium]|nr:hypothetical protein [Solirubrobacterales bacterium]
MTRIRPLIALLLALASVLLVAACGGGGNDEDPQQVLHQTFDNPTPIRSGTFDLDLRIETNGGEDPGKVEAKLGGKFQSRGPDQFPLFDFDVSLHGEGGAQSFSGTGGLTSTGDQAFLKFQGTEYAVPQALYQEFVTTYAQLQAQNQSNQGGGLLQALGIDVSRWLTDLNNDGTEDVEGTKTIHISGKANVNQFIEDLKKIAARAGQAAGQVNPAEFDQLKQTIESGDIDVNSGEDDKLLRRLQLDFELKPPPGTPGAPDSVSFFFQLNLADVNKTETIQAPANAQPLKSLLDRYGINLGDLGNTLRGGIGNSGALPESGGSTTAPSASATQRYQECLQQATGVSQLQRCAGLLGQ